MKVTNNKLNTRDEKNIRQTVNKLLLHCRSRTKRREKIIQLSDYNCWCHLIPSFHHHLNILILLIKLNICVIYLKYFIVNLFVKHVSDYLQCIIKKSNNVACLSFLHVCGHPSIPKKIHKEIIFQILKSM